ncbi:carbon-nitrogen hydrolase family protein [Cryomorphaceae bacterium 1068]|nr:carbon-nitrogen hydrolase family protein [Cryomorphaceae bacterium 1068]
MKVCLVQSQSRPGEIDFNIQNHINLIQVALQSKPDLIVFPELSLTGYEPQMAEELAFGVEDQRLKPFQDIADFHKVIVSIGLPIRQFEEVHISAVFFLPGKDRLLYLKTLLHEDELGFFSEGKNQPLLLDIAKKAAFGICYESLKRAFYEKVLENHAEMYIASVAKSIEGVECAYAQFPEIARVYNVPVLMSNCVGNSDDFVSSGQSAVWNQQGDLMGQLDGESQGLLFYDMQTEEVKIIQDL